MKELLPITIQNYYGSEVMKVVQSWDSYEDWIVVRFQGRVHRWREINNVWEPASASRLHRVYRQEWNGTTELPIDRGSYLVEGYALEDAWDTILAALDPFYITAFYNGDYDPNYISRLESRLTHLRT